MIRLITIFSLLCISFDSLAQQAVAQDIKPSTEKKIEQLQAELDRLKADLDKSTLTQVNRSNNSTDLTWSLSGRIHRVMMLVDDGAETNGFFMDSDQGPTMIRVDAHTPKSNSDWTLSGRLELGIQSNRSYQVSQDVANPGTDLTVRDADIKMAHQRYGQFSIGRGFSAAWVIPEVDVSGTVPAALLAVGNFAPGMKFVDTSTGELTDIRVHHYFADTERLLLVDRVRYDSPEIYNGITVSGTVAADNRWDTALRFYPETENFIVRTALTYQSNPFAGVENRIDGIVSAKHKETGLSLTTGYSLAKRELSNSYANSYVIKAGIQKNVFSIGSSAVSFDYSAGQDIRAINDDASSIGLVATQHWQTFNADLYVGLRRYSVNPTDRVLEDLNVAGVGFMFSF